MEVCELMFLPFGSFLHFAYLPQNARTLSGVDVMHPDFQSFRHQAKIPRKF